MLERQRPNLFDFATKELSQDAMICWLIKWADQQYADVDRELHECGRDFVGALLRQHADTEIPERLDTQIFQQDRGIDVLARVSPDHVLLIEDKTTSSDHGDQLSRYYDHVVGRRELTKLGKVPMECVYPIYFKTGNQPLSKDRQIENLQDGLLRPYKVFGRRKFLDVLRSYQGTHQSLKDYREYLERLEEETGSWETSSDWSWQVLGRVLRRSRTGTRGRERLVFCLQRGRWISGPFLVLRWRRRRGPHLLGACNARQGIGIEPRKEPVVFQGGARAQGKAIRAEVEMARASARCRRGGRRETTGHASRPGNDRGALQHRIDADHERPATVVRNRQVPARLVVPLTARKPRLAHSARLLRGLRQTPETHSFAHAGA